MVDVPGIKGSGGLVVAGRGATDGVAMNICSTRQHVRDISGAVVFLCGSTDCDGLFCIGGSWQKRGRFILGAE